MCLRWAKPVILLIIAGALTPSSGQPNPREPHYEQHAPGKPRVIIFVHGFTGTADMAWRADNGTNFPHLIATDPTIKLANIFVAAYSTHWTRENATIASLGSPQD